MKHRRKKRDSIPIVHFVGDVAIIETRHLLEALRRMNVYIGEAGGDCDDYCERACSGDDGCDFSFGESPDCGAACGNGQIYLALEP